MNFMELTMDKLKPETIAEIERRLEEENTISHEEVWAEEPEELNKLLEGDDE